KTATYERKWSKTWKSENAFHTKRRQPTDKEYTTKNSSSIKFKREKINPYPSLGVSKLTPP
ncbi:TPA: hypothetical protein ACOBEQ_002516, partial [Enterococcus faecium]